MMPSTNPNTMPSKQPRSFADRSASVSVTNQNSNLISPIRGFQDINSYRGRNSIGGSALHPMNQMSPLPTDRQLMVGHGHSEAKQAFLRQMEPVRH